MEATGSINSQDFVRRVEPLLASQNLSGLLLLLRSNWTADEITSLLSCPDHDARKVAALALALVGRSCCVPQLIERLRDPDPMTNEMAEHALWSIWFRCGTPDANEQLCLGSRALDNRDFESAHAHFARAMNLDPSFAEPYNQRAIAHYLTEHYPDSIKDCQAALERMPGHFGALAGMGHCHAHLGNLENAINCYKQALEINPHMPCIAESLAQLLRHLGREG